MNRLLLRLLLINKKSLIEAVVIRGKTYLVTIEEFVLQSEKLAELERQLTAQPDESS